MHRYRIVAQISLILSILNLVLAAPIAVQEIHKARSDDKVTADDVPAMPKGSDELEAASDKTTSLPSSPDTMASPQHSPLSDGSASSGYPIPHLSSDDDESVSGNSWLLYRRPRLNLDLPPSLQKSAFPHASSSGSSQIPPPLLLHWLQGLAPHPPDPGSGVSTPEWLQELERVLAFPSPHFTESNVPTTETSDKFTTSYHPSPSFSSMDWYSYESMPTPYSSAADGSLSSHYFSASGTDKLVEGSPSSLTPDLPPPSLTPGLPPPSLKPGLPPPSLIPDLPPPSLKPDLPPPSLTPGLPPPSLKPDLPPPSLTPSLPPPSLKPDLPPPSLTPGLPPPSLTPDLSQPPPSSPPPDNAEFFNKNMMKKLKIVAGVVIVGGVIAGIAGLQVKHQHRDYQDS